MWSHDSVGVGEDGPTHQPVEQLAAMRAMPGLRVIRPADANETAAAWRIHIDGDGPTAFILSRQKLPVLEGTAERRDTPASRRARTCCAAKPAPRPTLVLVGTGSEVSLCVEAADRSPPPGVDTRVVSMPCWELFEAREQSERDAVLPPGVPTLAVEAATSFGWDRYADATVTLDHFGASAPGDVVLREFGFTAEHVAEQAQALLASTTGGTR